MGPENVDVGPFLEHHVLDQRREEDRQRQGAEVTPLDDRARDDDRQRQLSDPDAERGEHQLDSVAARGQHRRQRSSGAGGAQEVRRQHVGDPVALAQDHQLDDQAHRHAEAHERPVAAERLHLQRRAPRLGEEKAVDEEARQEGRPPEVGGPVVVQRENEPQHAGDGIWLAPGADEPQVAPAGQDDAEDHRLLEVVVVRVAERDRQRDVGEGGEPARDRAPERPSDLEQQEGRPRHVDERRQPQHPVMKAEDLPEEIDDPEHPQRVVHVVERGVGWVIEVDLDRQQRLPAEGVVGRRPDHRRRGVVSVGERAADCESRRRTQSAPPGRRARTRRARPRSSPQCDPAGS